MVLAGSIMCRRGYRGGRRTPVGSRDAADVLRPGFFLTMAQGISLPFSQAGAMATNPQTGGHGRRIGVFMQYFGGAAFTQLYGLIANGTPGPLIVVELASAILHWPQARYRSRCCSG